MHMKMQGKRAKRMISAIGVIAVLLIGVIVYSYGWLITPDSPAMAKLTAPKQLIPKRVSCTDITVSLSPGALNFFPLSEVKRSGFGWKAFALVMENNTGGDAAIESIRLSATPFAKANRSILVYVSNDVGGYGSTKIEDLRFTGHVTPDGEVVLERFIGNPPAVIVSSDVGFLKGKKRTVTILADLRDVRAKDSVQFRLQENGLTVFSKILGKECILAPNGVEGHTLIIS